MSLTNDQLLTRIEFIEAKLNDIQTALNILVTKTQMKALTNVRQAEIEDLQERMTTTESRLTLLETP